VETVEAVEVGEAIVEVGNATESVADLISNAGGEPTPAPITTPRTTTSSKKGAGRKKKKR
jgi:hypothetical protein